MSDEIEIDDEVAERLAAAAPARGVTPEQLAAQIVAEAFPPRRRIDFVWLVAAGGGIFSFGDARLFRSPKLNETPATALRAGGGSARRPGDGPGG